RTSPATLSFLNALSKLSSTLNALSTNTFLTQKYITLPRPSYIRHTCHDHHIKTSRSALPGIPSAQQLRLTSSAH
ncbi:hypothetical protein FPQ18DRAFT_404487, partial [Pyronema domesticum]